MIIGMSGSGKSTLGNHLLNAANGNDEEYKDYFQAGDGVEGETSAVQEESSDDGTFRVIDTPGIPDPKDKETTLKYFDVIVKKIRGVYGLNLIIFLGHQLRVNPTVFRAYRTLLRQINMVDCAQVMVCRQSEYSRRPTKQMIDEKKRGGVDWVDKVLESSGLTMQGRLFMSGHSEQVWQSVKEIVDFARQCPPAQEGAATGLRTYPELNAFVEKLSDSSTRLQALQEETAALKDSVKSKSGWAWRMRNSGKFCYGAVVPAAACGSVPVFLGMVGAGWVSNQLAGFLESGAENPYTKAKIEENEEEINSGRVDPEKLWKAQQDFKELEAMAAF